MIVRDRARPYTFRGRRIVSAHLVSNLLGPAGTAELVGFATSIGMRASWIQYQGKPREHFDVWGERLAACDRREVPVINRQTFVAILRAKRSRDPYGGW